MMTDIEIAQKATMLPIVKVAEHCGILPDELEAYGKYKAKLSEELLERISDRSDGKLILVTAINPTPAGEGKTTTTVGLGQAFEKIGRNTIIALREPSLGPVMGIKGGAAGGGYAQVIPMDDINLHFTGDMHAIGAANNLLCAMLDNHLQQGNELKIDVRNIPFKRVMDMNDRALRNIIVGLGGRMNGVPREDGFMITVASEVMAILCLAQDMIDLKNRLGKIIAAYDVDGNPVTAADLGAQGAMALLLKDAIKPNLVQTLENTPCIMHGGPFANIAHGCNSIRATKTALKLADYCITEAGFGADLGAEKFFDIKCRKAGLKPDAVVVVATVRALKYNGGISKLNLKKEDLDALEKGIVNLAAHLDNMKKFGVPSVVAINVFDTDTEQELAFIEQYCADMAVACERCEVFAKGGEGGISLAKKVCEVIENQPSQFQPIYQDALSIKEKVEAVVHNIYGGRNVIYTKEAEKNIAKITEMGYAELPICIAKTQYSLSDDQQLLGRPTGFDVTVREARVSAGAGFIVMLTGEIMTMPGLPKVPAAQKIDILENGDIVGLF